MLSNFRGKDWTAGVDRWRSIWKGARVKLGIPSLSSVWRGGVFFLLLFLVVLFRCTNASEVFAGEGRVFFLDPDCYSRMTRVELWMENPGRGLASHSFENWPTGVVSHTTSLLDLVIAAGTYLLTPWTDNPLNLAGAWVSLFFGVATFLFLWFWAGKLELRYRWAMGLLYAASPMLVHGTILGRPDHQSLLIFLIAVGFGAEILLLAGRGSRAWWVVSGVAWGAALWVSLYEPLVLLLLAAMLEGIFFRGTLLSKERLKWMAGFGAIFGLGLLMDGWRLTALSPEVVDYFANWGAAIAELAPVSPFSPTLYRWTLALLPLAPVMLAVRFWKGDRLSGFWCGLLLGAIFLAMWQARWGYFLSLVFVMALPWVLSVFPKRWMALSAFVLGLWPVLQEWEDRLAISPEGQVDLARRYEQRLENGALYQIAQSVRRGDGMEPLGILAPWWQCPALAYWSRQPCVAGSSHQSLPGTVATSRFYVATDPEEASKILEERKVSLVLAYDAARVLSISDQILGVPEEGDPALTMASRLDGERANIPDGYQLVFRNGTFRIFRVVRE